MSGVGLSIYVSPKYYFWFVVSLSTSLTFTCLYFRHILGTAFVSPGKDFHLNADFHFKAVGSLPLTSVTQ